MPLNNSQNCNFEHVTFNTIHGNYVQHVVKDEDREKFERLSQNFDNEPYFSIRHEINLRNATEGTCGWLFEHQFFIQWRDDPATRQPVLWVHGPPGSGKSTLCSQAIRSLVDSPKKPKVAYHFCDFSRQHKELEILSMLAYQILEADLSALADLPPPTVSILSSPVQLKRTDRVHKLITDLIPRSPNAIICFLLDGVDEELGSSHGRWNDGILPVLQFLVALAADFPQHVRLWVSSQRREEIRDQLASFQGIDIDPFAQDDIVLYLSKEATEIKGPRESDKKVVLQNLQDRSAGSFIWVRLMVEELGQRSKPSDVKELIEVGMPRTLNDYYGKIFDRFPNHLRHLASMIFSLLVYAKRPLQLCELLEAVWCLSSKTKDVLDPDDKPYRDRLLDVMQPLIELVPIHPNGDEVEGSELQHTCRIIHSTLNEFLAQSPLTSYTDGFRFEQVQVCPEIPVTACLDYLLQSRFSDLLQKRGDQWDDMTGVPALTNQFLLYAAMYWDKHLDSITDQERQKALVPKVSTFINSPNFWTLLQVQTLWSQTHFSTLHNSVDDDAEQPRRMFPSWFSQTEEGHQAWMQTRSFLRQWQYFLCWGKYSGESTTDTSPYTGELDHIWTGALGPNHFLAKRRSRFHSFPIAAELPKHSFCQEQKMFFTDCTNESGSEMYTLEIRYAGKNLPAASGHGQPWPTTTYSATLICNSQTWDLGSNTPPILTLEQVLRVTASSCDFDFYIPDLSNPYAPNDRAPLASFYSKGQALRIGSKLFQRSSQGKFTEICKLHGYAPSPVAGKLSGYVEEVSRRKQFWAVTSRTKLSYRDSDEDLDGSAGGSDEGSEDAIIGIKDSESDSGSDGGSVVAASLGSISESSSTDDDEWFEDDSIVPYENDPEPRAVRDERDWDSDSIGSPSPGLFGPSSITLSPVLRPDPARWLDEDDDDDNDSKHWQEYLSDEFEPVDLEDSEDLRSEPCAIISVYDLGVRLGPTGATCLFRRQAPLKSKIYDSPPVFHPTKPLLVWPLGNGNILFVNYKKSTSFTRTLLPSTPFARHISIRCYFSTCGEFMHISAFEGRRPNPETIEEGNVALPPLHLAILALTYRLSPKNKQRSSTPTLVHRVRVHLQEVESISTRPLPFNLTWTRDYLYVTASWQLLHVWRVPLFCDQGQPGATQRGDGELRNCDCFHPVMTLNKTIFMPMTCTRRSVRFFPGMTGESPRPARVIVGHDVDNSKDQTLPPEGILEAEPEPATQFSADESISTLLIDFPAICYLDEEKDLGEWVDSKGRTQIAKKSDVGILIEEKEKKIPEGDCES